jgi:hypothetical protein
LKREREGSVNRKKRLGMMAHAYNSRYSGSRSRRFLLVQTSTGKKVVRSYIKNKNKRPRSTA